MLKDSRVNSDETDDYGRTPLFKAAWGGYLEGVKWWIASGREMDLGKPGDTSKTDAIGQAKRYGKTEMVTLLERFKSDAAKTRSEVRRELGINGQYSFYSPSCSYCRPFSFSVHDLLHFFFNPRLAISL